MKKLSDYKPLNWLQRWVVNNYPEYAPHDWIERSGAEHYRNEYGNDEDFEKDIQELKEKALKDIKNNQGEHKSDS